jgi:hypothetical protein
MTTTTETTRYVIQHRHLTSDHAYYRDHWADSDVAHFLFPSFGHSGPWHGNPDSFKWKRGPEAEEYRTLIRQYDNSNDEAEMLNTAERLLREMVRWDDPNKPHEFRIIKRRVVTEETVELVMHKPYKVA